MRTLDPETGAEQGRSELPATGDHFELGPVAITGDHRLVIDSSDLRVHRTRGETADHEPTLSVTQDSVPTLLVVEARDAAHPVVRARPRPTPISGPLPTKVAPSEAVFLERYATGRQELGVFVVDLVTGVGRRAVLLRPEHVAIGEGVDSTIVVLHVTADADRLTFAGMFAGTVAPLRARVTEIDACVANGHIECVEGRGMMTVAPFAGWIGTIELTPTH